MFRKKYYWTLAMIFILASNYLELNTGNTDSILFPGVKVSDLGMILYLFFFSHSILTYGVCKDNPLRKVVLVFLLFVLLSAVIDIYDRVALVDIIKVSRRWLYFTIVWIRPLQFSKSTLINSTGFNKLLRILLISTLVLTVLAIYQNITKTFFWGVSIDETRGMKPPFYVMLFIPLLFFDAIKYSKWIKFTFVGIMLFAVIMNLKQTYLFTIVLTLCVFLLMFQRKRITYMISIGMLLFIGTVILYNSNEKLKERIDQSLQIDKSVRSNSVDDNFSFRLLLAIERFDYIIREPKTAIRGMGFIHEEKVPETLFEIGTYSESNDRYQQTESADIAWAGLLMRLGLFGTLIFIILYLNIVVFLYKQALSSLTAAVFCSFMIVLVCFTSFGNAVMLDGYFYLLPLSLLTVLHQWVRMQKLSIHTDLSDKNEKLPHVQERYPKSQKGVI